jgi:hypothetical protein
VNPVTFHARRIVSRRPSVKMTARSETRAERREMQSPPTLACQLPPTSSGYRP